MNLINREASSHWYDWRNGLFVPMYEVPKKNGDGMKAVTLREARELLLWPSVTNVQSVMGKPGLEAWKIEQAIIAALTLPPRPNEQADDFAHRIVADMEAQSHAAKAFGHKIHDAIAMILNKNRDVDGISRDLIPYVQGLFVFLEEHHVMIFDTERVVGNRSYGYAGTLDLECSLSKHGHAIVDFKTQRIRRSANGELKPIFYPEWSIQLAAYGACLLHPAMDNWPALISVIVNSEEPGPIYVKVWENPEKLFRVFINCFELWCWSKDYYPLGLRGSTLAPEIAFNE